MVYIIIGIAGLLVTAALFTFLSGHKKGIPPQAPSPAEGCCGAHAICEKGLKKADQKIEYFEDEELDSFKGKPSDSYKDTEIDLFREVLYTLRKEEIAAWLISLEQREIALPDILRPEALEML